MLDATELASRLRVAMDHHHPPVTSAAVATECKVTPQAVAGWRKTGRMAKRHLQKIAKLTGRPLEYFLEDQHLARQNQASYLTDDEAALVQAYRAALPRWKLTLKHMLLVSPERQDEVAEALLILIAKIAAEPVSDARVEQAYGKTPAR